VDSAQPLPKEELKGAVVAQYRYYNGRALGPYWFRVWREGGRYRKVYVPRADLEGVRAACEAYRERRRALSIARRDTRRLVSDFAFLGRILMRLERLPEHANDLDYVSPREAARLNEITEHRFLRAS
jgi:hypothetical protein